jgi:hypothetical protein
MRSSRPVTENGALIAVAAEGDASRYGSAWFLIAIDPRLDELDRSNYRSAAEAEHAARSHLRRNHPAQPNAWR